MIRFFDLSPTSVKSVSKFGFFYSPFPLLRGRHVWKASEVREGKGDGCGDRLRMSVEMMPAARRAF